MQDFSSLIAPGSFEVLPSHVRFSGFHGGHCRYATFPTTQKVVSGSAGVNT